MHVSTSSLLANNSINAGNDDMVSARFEPSNKSSLSNQYANIQVAMSGVGGNNQYVLIPGVKPSTNYSSPNDVPIPTSDAHYKEFIGATQLMQMNQQAASQSMRGAIPPPPPPPLDAIE